MRAFCIVILAVAILQGYTSRVRAQLLNGIEAVVHDSVITVGETDTLNDQTIGVLRRQYADSPKVLETKLADMQRDNLETLIERQLVLREFKTAGYNLPESVLDEIVDGEIHARFDTRVNAVKTLEAEGLTLDKYRQQVRDDFIVKALRSKNVNQAIIISPHKVEAYYQAHRDDPDFKVEDEVKLSMIVLTNSAATAPQARKMAEEILARLNEGTSFQEMAKLYTQGSQRDGDMGWVGKKYFRKEVSDAAFSLKPGQHSSVVETPEACYLLRVEDIHPAHIKSLGEVRDQIESSLLTEEQKRLEKQWVERLKKKTFVRTY